MLLQLIFTAYRLRQIEPALIKQILGDDTFIYLPDAFCPQFLKQLPLHLRNTVGHVWMHKCFLHMILPP